MHFLLYNKTTRIIITFLLLLLFYNGYSQKCKYEKDEVDGVTELEIKRTVPEMILRINNMPVYIKAQSIGDNKYLKMIHQTYGEFHLQEDREISFILQNDQELTLFPRIMPMKDTITDAYTSMIVYKLSSIQVEILESSPVKAFKYYISTGWVEEEIKGSRQVIIMDHLRCVSETK